MPTDCERKLIKKNLNKRMELYKYIMFEAHFPHWQVANISSECRVSRANHVTICARTIRADTRQISILFTKHFYSQIYIAVATTSARLFHALASAECADICWRDYIHLNFQYWIHVESMNSEWPCVFARCECSCTIFVFQIFILLWKSERNS